VVVLATSRALGTGVRVGVTDEAALESADRIVATWLDDIDRACSRFRGDSDIARINSAGGQPVAVSRLCVDAVLVALRVAAATDGLVDPTVGVAMEAIGYDRDFADIVSVDDAIPAAIAAGWDRVEVDAEAGTVRVPDGVHLDLGASAKALAADRAADAAAAATGTGVLVNLGGDISVAGAAPHGGWHIRVTDDHDAAPDAPGQTVSITAGGLATSSTTVRRWRRGSREMHHIVDPRTGLPVPVRFRTVSVAAASCVDANAATTAAIVLGEDAPAWLVRHALPARLVDVPGRVTRLVGWPAATGSDS
jgi:thiamine biosynthesis lipoprotein ApbE